MAARRERADRACFRYEPSYPPTIPPGMTVAAYRRRAPGGRSAAAPAPRALIHRREPGRAARLANQPGGERCT